MHKVSYHAPFIIAAYTEAADPLATEAATVVLDRFAKEYKARTSLAVLL